MPLTPKLATTAMILVLFQQTLIAQVTNQNLFDTIPFLPEHYARRVALFEKEPVVTGKIIFAGNSITEMGRWSELAGKDVVNRGIGGDITFGLLKRLDDIIRRKPSKLFIMIGINDIGKDIPDAVIADNCRRMIERLKRESPGTTIYLQSMLPVNPTVRRFPQHYDKEHHIVHTNALLREVAEAAEIRFLNLYPLFTDDVQRLNTRYTTDGLHLNESGYRLWVDFLVKNECI